jgi:hypothetical protein
MHVYDCRHGKFLGVLCLAHDFVWIVLDLV